MRHHAWSQTVALDRKQTEHRAIDGDRNDAAGTFISMRDAEEERGCEHSDPETFARARKLLEKIAKGELFADARGNAEQHPQEKLQRILRRELRESFLRRGEMCEMQHDTDGCEQNRCCDPKYGGENEIILPVAPCRAALAEKLTQRNAAHANAPNDERCQNPLPRERGQILRYVMLAERVMRGFKAAEKREPQKRRDEKRGVPPRCNRCVRGWLAIYIGWQSCLLSIFCIVSFRHGLRLSIDSCISGLISSSVYRLTKKRSFLLWKKS